MDHVGKRIKQRRAAMGLSQECLGKKVGISAQTVSGWEGSPNSPPSKHIPALAKALDMEIKDLFPTEQLPPGAHPVGEMVMLPVVAQAQAGSPRLAVRDYEEQRP